MDDDDDDLKGDLITDLPQSILETILTKVSIRDAVRTSVLSTKWRYKWNTIPNLEFNDKCVISCYDRPISEHLLVTFITHCLFLHDGPIHKFALSTSFLQNYPVIDQWLLFVSRKGIKELTIQLGEGEWFRTPSCLFTCSKLTHLDLVRCELDPPTSFKGFLFLKCLNLQQVLIPPDVIESLISSCPLLESLMLSYFDGLELKLRAPNLKYLSLEGEFKDIHLENTPLLVDASVVMYMTDDIAEHFENSSSCNFDKFLGGIPHLERLVGQIYFTKYLSIGIERNRTSIRYNHLKSIELNQVSFEDDDEVLVLLALIVSSPNLKELQISGSSNASTTTVPSDWCSWEKEGPLDCMFNQLKTVKLTDMCGMLHEMGLIKFLLERAPILEVMTITPSPYATDCRFNMLINLARFKRASAQAEVIFIQDEV